MSSRIAQWLDRHRWTVGLLVAVAYVASYSGHWRIAPDTVDHVSMALNITNGQGFVHPFGLHAAIQPGWPYLLAGAMAVTGGDSLWLPHVLILAFGLATLALVYLWGRRVAGPGPAVGLVILVAGCETFYRYTHELLTDIPFAFGAMLMLLGWECLWPLDASAAPPRGVAPPAPRGLPVAPERRTGLGIALLFLGLATMWLFRSVALVFLGAMLLTGLLHLARRHPRWTALFAGGAAGLLVLGGLYGSRLPLDPMGDAAMVLGTLGHPGAILHRVFTRNLYELLTEVTGEGILGIDLGPVLCAAASVLIWITLVGLFRVRLFWGMLLLALAAQWLVFWPADRYLVPILPLAALAWWRLALWTEQRARPGTRRRVFIAMLALWIAPNGVMCAVLAYKTRALSPAITRLSDLAHHPDPAIQLACRLRDPSPLGAAPTQGRPILVLTDHPDAGLLTIASAGKVAFAGLWAFEQINTPQWVLTPAGPEIHDWLRDRRLALDAASDGQVVAGPIALRRIVAPSPPAPERASPP